MTVKRILVFGSNVQGIHGKGSALLAKLNYGAEQGVGAGRTGDAYAIPTRTRCKDGQFRTLPLSTIRAHVDTFVAYAACFPRTTFAVVKIACGNAGYAEEEVAPLFVEAPANVELPWGWRTLARQRNSSDAGT